MADTEVLVDGLGFAEGPRWHDDRLWFSDMHDGQVKAVDGAGDVEVMAAFDGRASGLGWDPDGRLLVVSMDDRRLLRFGGDGGDAHEVADLSSVSAHQCNDMVVDPSGRAYIGNFGFDHFGGERFRSTSLHMVDVTTGEVRVVAEDLRFPNGMVLTPDGATLIVGESYGARLTAFTVGGDGSLDGRRVFATLDGATPDGICLDAEGAVWVASPVSNEVLRVHDGGEISRRVSTGDRMAIACMLGGHDRRTLFVCTAETSTPAECLARRSARIETATVDVPGGGHP